MQNIIVKEKVINITGINDDDYVSLTDIARFKTDGETNPVIANWMRKVDTLEYLKLWEQINNPNFKPTDFEGFKSKPGENAFTISPKKWIELAILSNLEYHNSLLIKDDISQKERLITLNNEANREKELFNKNNVKKIEAKHE